jgi:hypothetical protein
MQPPTFMQKAAPESAGLVGNSTVRPDRCVPCWLYPSAMGKARCESCCFTTHVVRLLVRIPFGSSEFNGRCHHTRRFCRIVTRPPLRRPDCPWPSTPSLRNYTGRSILRPLRLRRSWKSPPAAPNCPRLAQDALNRLTPVPVAVSPAAQDSSLSNRNLSIISRVDTSLDHVVCFSRLPVDRQTQHVGTLPRRWRSDRNTRRLAGVRR